MNNDPNTLATEYKYVFIFICNCLNTYNKNNLENQQHNIQLQGEGGAY